MLEQITGDLLANLERHSALLHGVNTQGVFGAGFAAGLKQVYSACVPVYEKACIMHALHPGNIVVYVPPEDAHLPQVIHAATQEFYGKKGRAKVEWVQAALSEARSYLETHDISEVALPKIESGLGGLSWELQVLPMLQVIFASWTGTAIVYSLT